MSVVRCWCRWNSSSPLAPVVVAQGGVVLQQQIVILLTILTRRRFLIKIDPMIHAAWARYQARYLQCAPPRELFANCDWVFTAPRAMLPGSEFLVELATNIHKDFTITEKAPTRLMFKNLLVLGHYARTAPNYGKLMQNWYANTKIRTDEWLWESMRSKPPTPYDICVSIPISCLLTIG